MTIYISNLSEDVWPFIRAITSPQEREFELQENANLAERDLFSFPGEDDVLFIAPSPISQEFFSYYLGLFGNKNFSVLVPRVHTGTICDDILADKHCLAQIKSFAKHTKKVTVLSYTVSAQFLRLVSELRKMGIAVYTPEAPREEDSWTIDFFGSKSGIRQLAQKSGAQEPDFVMPDGLVCFDIADAAKIAAKKYISEKGVVVKTNKGHAGAGVLIFRPGDLPKDFAGCTRALYAMMAKNKYWSKFPIIIESYIKENPAIAGGSPNVEFKISQSGVIDYTYVCGMRMTREGVFKGIEVHKDVMSEKIVAHIVDTGFFVAEQYASHGYRGYFELDFVASKGGKLYVTESNLRRNGGTHVFKTAEYLLGKDFDEDWCTLSNNVYRLPHKRRMTFGQIKNLLEPLLYNKKTKEGVILVSERLLSQQAIGYILFGKTKKRALAIESEMEELLR